MDQHIKIVAILQYVSGALYIAIGAALLVFGAAIGAASGDRDVMFFSGTCGGILAIFLFIIALPSILAGWGLMRRREWARILTIVLSIFHLFSVPIGTAIGAYSMWALLSEDARGYFA